MLNKLNKRLLGGYVSRYHTRPEVADGQNVADHTWGALAILTTLWEDASRDAMLYLLYHDVVESELGDLPAPTKWNYKNLDKAYSEAEAQQEKDLELLLFRLHAANFQAYGGPEIHLYDREWSGTGGITSEEDYRRASELWNDKDYYIATADMHF